MCLNSYFESGILYNACVPRICIIPKASTTGGVTSFQAKLAQGLARRGIDVCHSLAETPYEAVLLTGGVRDLPGLLRARRRGIRLVQRLDGINWLHRRLPTGVRHFLRAEYGNRLLAFLRSRLVTHIIYQSEFVRGWWRYRFSADHVPSTVIYNGVDLGVYTPKGPPTGRRIVSACCWWRGVYKAATSQVCRRPSAWQGCWLRNFPSN